MNNRNTSSFSTDWMRNKSLSLDIGLICRNMLNKNLQPLWRALLLIGGIVFAVPQAVAVIPTGTFVDTTWTLDPAVSLDGRHSVPSTSYIYSEERYELSVDAAAWLYSADFSKIYSGSGANAGKYYRYGDLSQVVLTDDGEFWTIRISVVNDDTWNGAEGSPTGVDQLKGRYAVYFGQFGDTEHWLFGTQSLGLDLSNAFSTAGNGMAQESADSGKRPPYGVGITTTFDDAISEGAFEGYKEPVGPPTGLVAMKDYDPGNDVYDVIFRYRYTGAGSGPITEAVLANLDYLYVGVAVSNPSSSQQLFANDHFGETGGTSAEYDTLKLLGPTFASISTFEANTSSDGVVEVEWSTSLEAGTLGFHVERWDEATNTYVRLNDEMLPSLQVMGSPQGGVYRLKDENVSSGESHRYRLIEEENLGGERTYGPFDIVIDG